LSFVNDWPIRVQFCDQSIFGMPVNQGFPQVELLLTSAKKRQIARL
jgi:hypothetical protein